MPRRAAAAATYSMSTSAATRQANPAGCPSASSASQPDPARTALHIRDTFARMAKVVDAQVAVVVDRWLAPDGLVVVERATRDTPPSWPDSLTDQRTRRYGETTLYLASKEDDQ